MRLLKANQGVQLGKSTSLAERHRGLSTVDLKFLAVSANTAGKEASMMDLGSGEPRGLRVRGSD